MTLKQLGLGIAQKWLGGLRKGELCIFSFFLWEGGLTFLGEHGESLLIFSRFYLIPLLWDLLSKNENKKDLIFISKRWLLCDFYPLYQGFISLIKIS